MSDAITIVGLEVSNFRRLRAAHVEYVPGTGLVRVTGKNAAGKTSLLKAIAGALGGAGQVHEDSLHEGAEDGRVILRLSNGYTVERRHTAANPKGSLVVVGPDEGRHSQRKLNEWLGERSFDPLAFYSLSPDRQRDTLFAIGTDPGLPKKLQDVRAEYRQTYDERTPVISRIRELRKVEKPAGERPEPVDTSAELARLRELNEAARQLRDLKRDLDEADRRYREATSEVRRLEDQLRMARQKEENALRVYKAARQEWESIADPAEEIEAVTARLDQVSAINAALEPWKRWESASAELEALARTEEDLTAQLGSLKRREADLLEKAGIPVPGLSFGDAGEPLLNGKPLALASGAERIEVSVRVALAADPHLKVCLLDEANDLDLDAVERLDALAKEHGFQIWAVRIGLEGPGEVVVDDGKAWSTVEEVAHA